LNHRIVQKGRGAAEKAERLANADDERWRGEGVLPHLTAASFFDDQAEVLEAVMARERNELTNLWATPEMKLGTAIQKKKMKAQQLVNEWDKKGKGCVSKVEFRQGVKASLGLTCDMRTLDSMFDRFDDDGGGTLDAGELRDVLHRVNDNVNTLKQREETLDNEQAVTQAKVVRLRSAARLTRDARSEVKAALLLGLPSPPIALAQQSVNQSVDQSVDQSVSESANQSVSQSAASRAIALAEAAQEMLAAEEAEAIREEEERRAEAEMARAEEEARAAAARRQAEEDAAVFDTSDVLTNRAKVIREVVGSLDPKVITKTLEQQLGELLVKKSAKPADLVREWDRKQKGEVNKVEFRQGVRNVGVKADNKEIDSFFQTLDSDGGGSLDAAELKEALKISQDAASLAMEESEVRHNRQLRLKDYLNKLEGCIGMAMEAEVALAKHQSLKSAAELMGGLVDSAVDEVQAAYKEAAALKRTAIKAQLELAEAERARKATDKREDADLLARRVEKERLAEVERERQAEKERRKVAEAKKKKEDAAKRIAEKNAKAFGLEDTSTREEDGEEG